MRIYLVMLAAALALIACSESPAPQDKAAEESRPAQQAEAAPKELSIEAPSGEYRLDPNHANLSFSLMHLDLSNYIARFTDFDVLLDLDSENLSDSSVIVTLNPASVETDFVGDYKATHEDSPYESWNQDLAQSPKFFNAGKYPVVSFQSTGVEPTDAGTLNVVGDLTLLGRTRPVTFDVEVTGDVATHPFTGNGALGFAATGKIKRSDFGMTHLLDPPLVGDEVTIRFNGELHQAVKDNAAPEDNAAEE